MVKEQTERLTRAELARAAAELASRDGDFARVLERYGTPPLWEREPGFGTLVHIILEQQVSLASAAGEVARELRGSRERRRSSSIVGWKRVQSEASHDRMSAWEPLHK